MKTNALTFSAIAALAAVSFVTTGCNRQTRGNADANAQRAATPQEGGGTSTAGAAGDPKYFGDTRATQKKDGTSPSASPTGLSKDAKPGDVGGAVNPPDAKTTTK